MSPTDHPEMSASLSDTLAGGHAVSESLLFSGQVACGMAWMLGLRGAASVAAFWGVVSAVALRGAVFVAAVWGGVSVAAL